MENFFSEIILPFLVMIIVFINIIRKSNKPKNSQPEDTHTENFPPIPYEYEDKQEEEMINEAYSSPIVQEEKLEVKAEKKVTKVKSEVSTERKKTNPETEQEQPIAIELSDTDDFKKAVIYSEILNRKF